MVGLARTEALDVGNFETLVTGAHFDLRKIAGEFFLIF
jgi:hypothetical protein